MLFDNKLDIHTSVIIKLPNLRLEGDLTIPENSRGIVIFAHGSGSGRHSPRNRFVAKYLNQEGFSTLLMDLLSVEEEAIDIRTAELRFDINLLAERLVHTSHWLQHCPDTKNLSQAYFGASTGAAAAIVAASQQLDQIKAIVSRGGRPDLAGEALSKIVAPILLIVGKNDPLVVDLNRQAQSQIKAVNEFVIVPHATHLFEEPGALEGVAHLAVRWLKKYLL